MPESSLIPSMRASSARISCLLGHEPLGGESPGHGQRLGVVAETEVVEAFVAGGEGHLLQRGPAVGPVGVDVEVPAHIRKIDEVREQSCFGRLDLPLVLAQFRGYVAQTHQFVDLGFGGAADEAPGLEVLHAVLADLVSAALGVSAQRDVVVGAAGEVLQEVAVGLGRNDAQVDVQAGVGGRGQLRIALGFHPGQLGQAGEGRP